MALTSERIENEINKVYDELEAIHHMDDAEVLEKYNVDKREEIILLLNEELEDLRNDYELQAEAEEQEERFEKEAILFSFRNPIRQLLMDY